MVINKKGLKLCGLLLALFITLGLSLNASLKDTNALRHDYDSVQYHSLTVPCPDFNSETGTYFIPSSFPNSITCFASHGSSFSISFEGTASDSNPSGLKPNLSYLFTYYNRNNDSLFSYNTLLSIFPYSPNHPFVHDSYISNFIPTSYQSSYLDWFYSNSSSWNNSPAFYSEFGSDGVNRFDNNSSGILSCDPWNNGASCGGLWNTSEYISSQILNRQYTADGFYLHNTALDSDGISRSYTFTLSDLFDVDYVDKFSRLSIPLYDDTSLYFLDPSNLYNGRQFDFQGSFEFKGNFSWNQEFLNNGSFRLYYDSVPKYNAQSFSRYVDCSVRVTGITPDGSNGKTVLRYSCPVTLSEDLISMSPYLVIDGGQNYVWQTDDDWVWSSSFVVTDGDDTPGQHFSTTRYGGGDGSNVIGSDAYILQKNADPDIPFFSQLANLFGFGFLNPFAGIFNLFGDSSTCASIPTIASMIHSEETTVCPWFDSNTRSITTPVVGLASVMLVFGFAVRWLGSSSGNLFEDSGHEEISNVKGSGWRRFKK